MAKKGDSNNKPYGGVFDFNRDGKVDPGERWIGIKAIQDCLKMGDDYEDNSWHEYCYDGIEYGIYPEDYETEEEYEEALEEAQYGGTDYDEVEIKQSDYPNKRQYMAAVTLAERNMVYVSEAYERVEKDRCRFILEQNKKVVAANYLTADGFFLFSQAIKDNFDIPVTLPDEDETSDFSLEDILKKIQKKDVALALKVWEWCIEQFLPYADYTLFGRSTMTTRLLSDLHSYSDEFRKAFREYLNDHADFRMKLVREADEMPGGLAELIVSMIEDGYIDAAKSMFDDGLFRSEGKWKQVNKLMGELILFSKNYRELETIEFVEQNFLPRMQQYSDGMILDEIEGWQQEITEYKQEVERKAEKYAFSRINAWRNNVPDGSEYGLNPCYYYSEQEYLEALHDRKYSWRKWHKDRDNYGLNPDDFETQEEFRQAFNEKMKEARQHERDKRLKEQQLAEQAKLQEYENDKNIYIICGVTFPHAVHPYHYRTEDATLKIGDTVLVPVGEQETEGTIISVGQYTRQASPFPVEKTRMIIRKVDDFRS